MSTASSRAAALAVLVLVPLVLTSAASAAGGATKQAARARHVNSRTRMPSHGSHNWKLIFRDGFHGTKLAKQWGVYGPSVPSSTPTTSYWKPSHVRVGNGKLTLVGKRDSRTGRIVTGGLGLWNAKPRKYGKFEMLVRMPSCSEVKYAWLLWPSDGRWPQGGEIDFGEDGGGRRTATTATITYANNWGARAILPQRSVRPSRPFSKWHVVGVEWRKKSIKYTLDGRVWATERSAHVPSDPMVLVMQTESLVPAGQVPRSFTSCNAQVGWVAEFAPRH